MQSLNHSLIPKDHYLLIDFYQLNQRENTPDDLIELAKKDNDLQQNLFKIIEDSAIDERFHIAAENAMMILKKAQVSFKGRDFSAVRISGQFESFSIRTLRDHKQSVISLVELECGLFASGSLDGKVKIWENFSCIRTLKHKEPPDLMKWLKRYRLFVTMSHDLIKIWDPDDNFKCIKDISCKNARNVLHELPNGSFIVWENKVMKIIDPGKEYKCTEKSLPGDGKSICYLKDGKYALSCNLDRKPSIAIVDPICSVTYKMIPLENHERVISLFVNRQHNLVSTHLDGSIRVWDTKQNYPCILYMPEKISPFKIHPISENLIGLIHREDPNAIELRSDIADFSFPAQILKEHTKPIRTLCRLNNGMLLSGSEDGTIKVWEPALRSNPSSRAISFSQQPVMLPFRFPIEDLKKMLNFAQEIQLEKMLEKGVEGKVNWKFSIINKFFDLNLSDPYVRILAANLNSFLSLYSKLELSIPNLWKWARQFSLQDGMKPNEELQGKKLSEILKSVEKLVEYGKEFNARDEKDLFVIGLLKDSKLYDFLNGNKEYISELIAAINIPGFDLKTVKEGLTLFTKLQKVVFDLPYKEKIFTYEGLRDNLGFSKFDEAFVLLKNFINYTKKFKQVIRIQLEPNVVGIQKISLPAIRELLTKDEGWNLKEHGVFNCRTKFTKYWNGGMGAYVSDPTTTHLQSCNLENFFFTNNREETNENALCIDTKHFYFKGFSFQKSHFHDFDFSYTFFEDCNFQDAIFSGKITFSKMQIDALTAKTFFPALRKSFPLIDEKEIVVVNEEKEILEEEIKSNGFFDSVRKELESFAEEISSAANTVLNFFSTNKDSQLYPLLEETRKEIEDLKKEMKLLANQTQEQQKIIQKLEFKIEAKEIIKLEQEKLLNRNDQVTVFYKTFLSELCSNLLTLFILKSKLQIIEPRQAQITKISNRQEKCGKQDDNKALAWILAVKDYIVGNLGYTKPLLKLTPEIVETICSNSIDLMQKANDQNKLSNVHFEGMGLRSIDKNADAIARKLTFFYQEEIELLSFNGAIHFAQDGALRVVASLLNGYINRPDQFVSQAIFAISQYEVNQRNSFFMIKKLEGKNKNEYFIADKLYRGIS